MTVELVKALDGTVVKSWTPAAGGAGHGRERVLERHARQGGRRPGPLLVPPRPRPRPTASSRAARRAPSGERDAFDLYDNVFPIRGRHAYGSGAGRFGAGRGGHSHQGQDVFANCGTRLVAARGGTVKYAGYQGRAGNYLVIDGDGTGEDYAYMHLAQPSPFRTGDRVYTGQTIGVVGDTGDALRLPPALRALVGARLVQRRPAPTTRCRRCRPGTAGPS